MKSTHIRTRQILIRKNHEAFRGASVCTQIVGQEWKAFSPPYRLPRIHLQTSKLGLKNHVTPAKRPPCTSAETASSVSTVRCILPTVRIATDQNTVSLHSQGKYAHIRVVTNKRNRRIKDLLHRASSKVASYCLENNIGTLVIGYNKHWKQEINIGRVNNQKFVGIPHVILISQIQYKCQSLGVTTVIQEESYTSKDSALDNDFMPVYGNNPENVVPLFSGKRIRRGLSWFHRISAALWMNRWR